jgi:ABC-type Mn2+/Zn2+ transport system ATPase subunit
MVAYLDILHYADVTILYMEHDLEKTVHYADDTHDSFLVELSRHFCS